ncbi:MAG: glycoside hydrolase family 88 protein [Verrucomicrobiota bacterium]
MKAAGFSALAAALLAAASSVAGSIQPCVTNAFTPQAVLATMKCVADWQLAQPLRHPADDWTYGALYAGMEGLAGVADDPKYQDAMLAMGTRQHWQPGSRVYHADDHCVTQTYLDLYLQYRDPAMIGPVRERFDFIAAHGKTNELKFETDASSERWLWCDSLFMGPAAWMRLYNATGDPRYLEFLDREWRATSDFLYDPGEHLFFRDSRYFNKREANGQKVFWSRGNGWVIAGLARVLQNMPPDHVTRPFYIRQFQEMAAKILSLQQPDGLWHSSLLDPQSYPLKETSGSGFYTFALAWGINRGLLDRAAYEPAVRKAWAALVDCVTPDGKLEHVQPIGADPKRFDPGHTDVFGVGAFLLAGSEVYRLALDESPAAAYAAFQPQRLDDFAWENDRIAFRAYGPALARTGEIGSGIDVWVKRTRRPVIESWYFKADYHEDHGEGLDMYKVGPSRGCGGTGVWRNGKLYAAGNFQSWRLLENGPQRVVFELTYPPYDAGGIQVREIKRITLDAGSNLNRIDALLDWDWDKPENLELAIGLVRRGSEGSLQVGTNNAWMTYWEPEQLPNGTIGCAVIPTTPARLQQIPGEALLITTVHRGVPVTYYAGAGWTRSGDFPDREAWVNAVARQAAELAKR